MRQPNLHFSREEYVQRMTQARLRLVERGLDALLLFAPESHYYLTGFDTTGYVFFQCAVLMAEDDAVTLLTRRPDVEQARRTLIIEDIRVWYDTEDANPAQDLKAILSAALMGQHGVVLVPTLAAYEVYARYGREQGVSEETLQQIELARGVGPDSVRTAMAAGVTIASGSDVYGQNAGHMAMELELKAQIMGNMASLIAATKTNAQLLDLADQIGTLEPGKLADVIVVDGNPVDDITVLRHPANISLVMQAGHLVQGMANASLR